MIKSMKKLALGVIIASSLSSFDGCITSAFFTSNSPPRFQAGKSFPFSDLNRGLCSMQTIGYDAHRYPKVNVLYHNKDSSVHTQVYVHFYPRLGNSFANSVSIDYDGDGKRDLLLIDSNMDSKLETAFTTSNGNLDMGYDSARVYTRNVSKKKNDMSEFYMKISANELEDMLNKKNE